MRLLLAEDEKNLSRALQTILTHNNYTVDAVFNGQDAYDYLSSGLYDGAILDIMMPKMDGIAVVKKLRSEGSNTPILLLTAKSDIDDLVLGLDSGADDYLPKPFSTKELLARVRSMLRHARPSSGNLLEYGNIKLDRASFELYSDICSFRLANKEFQMMELLMLNPKTVISAERFMEKIWGSESGSEINVVWVYISYLRKKLLNLGADIAINSSRNIGYFLEKKESEPKSDSQNV